jgi:hypothetical protein
MALSCVATTNTLRIENIERCFGSSGKRLLKQGRVLIGEVITDATRTCVVASGLTGVSYA